MAIGAVQTVIVGRVGSAKNCITSALLGKAEDLSFVMVKIKIFLPSKITLRPGSCGITQASNVAPLRPLLAYVAVPFRSPRSRCSCGV